MIQPSQGKSDLNGNRKDCSFGDVGQRSAWSRTLPVIITHDGHIIDPDDESFMMNVCREVDRSLLRQVKDAPIPKHIINYRDSNGLTPLGFLALKGDFILVKLLCEMKGVECNVQDNEGNTPLMIASQGGHSNVVAFLLERFKGEIDINRRNVFGFTAVMKAALQGRIKCLRSLLSAGANVTLRDPNKGFTALEWAEFCGRRTCAEIIRNYSSKGNNGSGSSSSRGKRLSQAFSETEAWIKRLGNLSKLTNSSSPPSSPTTPPSPSASPNSNNYAASYADSSNVTCNLLARASAASALCTTLPLITSGVQVPDDGDQQRLHRIFVIPSIQVTQE